MLPGCNQFVRCARDERGWIIPRVGTVTREIYDLLVQGKSRREIVEAFPDLSARGMDARIWKIKHPDYANARRNAANTKLRAGATLLPTLALPAPPKLPWSTPDIWETGRIKPAGSGSRHVLVLDDDDDRIIIRRPTIYRGVRLGKQWFLFEPPLLFSPAHYYVEMNSLGQLEMGEIDGEFDDVARARPADSNQ